MDIFYANIHVTCWQMDHPSEKIRIPLVLPCRDSL